MFGRSGVIPIHIFLITISMISRFFRDEITIRGIHLQKFATNTLEGDNMQYNLDLIKENRLITGEKLSTKLAVNNITVVQKARLLSQLESPSEVEIAKRDGLELWLNQQCFSSFCGSGECRHASMAFVRYLAAIGDDTSISKANRFVHELAAYRDGRGRWKGFPFYYTLLALKELGTDRAKAEREYALPARERALKRISSDDEYFEIRESISSKDGTLGLSKMGSFEGFHFQSSI